MCPVIFNKKKYITTLANHKDSTIESIPKEKINKILPFPPLFENHIKERKDYHNFHIMLILIAPGIINFCITLLVLILSVPDRQSMH